MKNLIKTLQMLLKTSQMFLKTIQMSENSNFKKPLQNLNFKKKIEEFVTVLKNLNLKPYN